MKFEIWQFKEKFGGDYVGILALGVLARALDHIYLRSNPRHVSQIYSSGAPADSHCLLPPPMTPPIEGFCQYHVGYLFVI